MIGMLLIVCLPLNNNGGRLAGYYLTQASPTAFVALMSLVAGNVAGYTKKTTVAALYLIGYCVGNIIVSLVWFSHSFSLCRQKLTKSKSTGSANFPTRRQTTLRPSRNHHHSLLGGLHSRRVVYLLVL